MALVLVVCIFGSEYRRVRGMSMQEYGGWRCSTAQCVWLL